MPATSNAAMAAYVLYRYVRCAGSAKVNFVVLLFRMHSVVPATVTRPKKFFCSNEPIFCVILDPADSRVSILHLVTCILEVPRSPISGLPAE
jgi:hypothetical protein